MSDAFIFDHVRTPRGRGKPDGALHEATPLKLARTVLEALRERNALDTTLLDDVVLGCVEAHREQGLNIARAAVLAAGYADSVAGMQVNRFCASGLEAINIGAAQVLAGQADAVIAGGVESMSRVKMGSSGGAWPADPAVAQKCCFLPQGISADLLATLHGLGRDAVDAYAVQSQRRAAASWRSGRFARSIVPVRDQNGVLLLDRDEHLRPDTTLESLSRLTPSFQKLGEDCGFDALAMQRYPQIAHVNHVHHAGNSSGVVDGAAAVLLGTREFGRKAGLRPRARIRGFASIGSEPSIMLTGPVAVSRKLLQRNGVSADRIDLCEINEAFASVVLHFVDELALDPDTVNVNGGAIAMGHPLGATGAIILGTLLDELETRDRTLGLVTLCVAAGMGTATLVERV